MRPSARPVRLAASRERRPPAAPADRTGRPTTTPRGERRAVRGRLAQSRRLLLARAQLLRVARTKRPTGPRPDGPPMGGRAAKEGQARRGRSGSGVGANITRTMSALRTGPRDVDGPTHVRDGVAREELEAQRAAEAERERKTVRVNEFITVSELARHPQDPGDADRGLRPQEPRASWSPSISGSTSTRSS